MDKTIILFSGLAGTGKTTLARGLARRLGLPVFGFDHLMDEVLPRHVIESPGQWTNEDLFEMLFKLTEYQMGSGVSVILDAVFMGEGRTRVKEIANRYQARLCAIHTLCSDETLWRDRVMQRVESALPNETPAKWEGILSERNHYKAWNPTEALFVDAVQGIDENLERVVQYVTKSWY